MKSFLQLAPALTPASCPISAPLTGLTQVFGKGRPGEETWGPVWGKDETTRFQSDAVRNDLRLRAEGEQVVQHWEVKALKGGEAGRGVPVTSLQSSKLGGGQAGTPRAEGGGRGGVSEGCTPPSGLERDDQCELT